MRSTLLILLIALLGASSSHAQLGFPQGVEEPERPIVEITPAFSVSSAEPGRAYDAALVVKVISGWHINSAKPHQEWLIPTQLAIDSTPVLTVHGIAYPVGEDKNLMDEVMSLYDGRVIIRFKVAVAANVVPGEHALPLHFTYQPCNNTECRAPQTLEASLRIAVGAAGGRINADIFGSGADTPPREPAHAASGEENELERLIAEHGFWGYFLALGIAFVTGLLLSFSPCTYPMIPITVSVFAGQQRSMGRGFVLSLFYVGSMAVVYGIMGLVVALVGGVFGAWLASTPVIIGIVVVFVVFSLSMFGLYELQVPMALRQRLGKKASGKGVAGSIVLGVVAALVVSPCVGPFVAGILVYIATSGSPLVGFLVLFVFALGLGTLYVIIGTFSSAIRALPGAGGWMESIKKFFGFVLLLMAIYFLRTIIPPSLTAVLTGLLLVALGVFGGGLDRLTSESGFFVRLKKLLGIVAFLVGIYLLAATLLIEGFILPPAAQWLPSASSVTQAEPDLIDWERDLETGLTRASREGKPVLIDTWATWCVNCRVLDKKTFHNPAVAEEARRFVPIKVQLESAGSPVTKDFMNRFGLKQYSLPTTLLLDSSGRIVRTLRGVVAPEEMIAAMRRAQ